MSSRKLQPITRTIQVASFSWATNTLTINTTGNHGLLDGDVISFTDQTFPELVTGAITSVDADTFTIATTNSKVKVPNSFTTEIFNTGATGAQEAFTWGFGDNPTGIVQVSSDGSSTVTVSLEGSLDGVNWTEIVAGTAITAGNSAFLDVTKPYVYGRINFTVAVALGGVKAYRVVA